MAVHVLEFSIVLQLAAVFVALRLGDVTGWRVAWILIAFGLLLMGASQATALYQLLSVVRLLLRPGISTELITQSFEASMVTLVALFAPLIALRWSTRRGRRAGSRNMAPQAVGSGGRYDTHVPIMQRFVRNHGQLKSRAFVLKPEAAGDRNRARLSESGGTPPPAAGNALDMAVDHFEL